MTTSQLIRADFKPNLTCIFDAHLDLQSISNHYTVVCFGHFHSSLLFGVNFSDFHHKFLWKFRSLLSPFTFVTKKKFMTSSKDDLCTFERLGKSVEKAQKIVQFSWNNTQMPRSKAIFWIFLPIFPKSHYLDTS